MWARGVNAPQTPATAQPRSRPLVACCQAPHPPQPSSKRLRIASAQRAGDGGRVGHTSRPTCAPSYWVSRSRSHSYSRTVLRFHSARGAAGRLLGLGLRPPRLWTGRGLLDRLRSLQAFEAHSDAGTGAAKPLSHEARALAPGIGDRRPGRAAAQNATKSRALRAPNPAATPASAGTRASGRARSAFNLRGATYGRICRASRARNAARFLLLTLFPGAYHLVSRSSGPGRSFLNVAQRT